MKRLCWRADNDWRAMKHHKYHAKRTRVGNHWFPSRAEAARYCQLLAAEQSMQIKDLSLQPKVMLAKGIAYRPDFTYLQRDRGATGGWRRIWEDVKGCETPVFKLKLKLWQERMPNQVLKVIKMRSRDVNLWLGIGAVGA